MTLINIICAVFIPALLAQAAPTKDITLPPKVPKKILITDKPTDPAGKLVKIRYGPYKVEPGIMFQSAPSFFGGPKISTPCEECFVASLQGGMEYEDGSDANVDSGLYQHHFALVNLNKPDWLCGLELGGWMRSQWIYNGGNEHPPVRLNTKHKFGIKVEKGDQWTGLHEVMNMGNVTKTVYATMVYEVIPIDTPGYREATMLRMGVWHCGEVDDVPGKSGTYTYTGVNWTSPYAGVVLHNDGHGHPGVSNIKLNINNKTVCNSEQYYGLEPRWVAKNDAGEHGHGGMKFLSHATICSNEFRIEKGDQLSTEAFYDGHKHQQMVFMSHIDDQMGFNFLYLGRDENTLNDTLNITKRWDHLPREMKVPSLMGQAMDRLTRFTGLDMVSLFSNPNGIDLQSLVDQISHKIGMNLTVYTSNFTTTGRLPTIATRPSPNVPFGGAHIPADFDLTPWMKNSSSQFFNVSSILENGGISINPVEPFTHLLLDSLDGKNISFVDMAKASVESLKQMPALSGMIASLASGAGLEGLNLDTIAGLLGGLEGGTTSGGGFESLAGLLGGLGSGNSSSGGLDSLMGLFEGLSSGTASISGLESLTGALGGQAAGTSSSNALELLGGMLATLGSEPTSNSKLGTLAGLFLAIWWAI